MSQDVDLRELVVDRGGTSLRPRRHLFTRYVLPLLLLTGFLSLVAWAVRDLIAPPRAVTVVPVYSTSAEIRQEGTPLFQAAGWIEPRPTPVRVAALAPGVVQELLVVEDQLIQSGEPIAELVKEDAQLVLQAAIADLELRMANLDEANAALAAAETRIKQPVHLQAPAAEAAASLARIDTQLQNLPFQLRRAQADLEAMQQDYEGKRAAKGVIAGVQIDIAKSKAAAAKALVEELQDRSAALKQEQTALAQRRDALKTQLELQTDEIKAKAEAAARVRAATARTTQGRVAVAEAKLRLKRMTVVSPIDARVYRLIAQPGARLATGTGNALSHDDSTVVTLYRPDMLQIRVDVRFEDLPNVGLGQPVEVNNPALSSPLAGNVLFISSEADIQKNTVQVKVEIPDPSPLFKPEMLVDATFLAPKQTKQASEESQELKLYVLKQLIHQDGGESFVWLADQSEGIARKTTIQTGTVGSNGLVEVTRGLTPSSRIIVVGNHDLQHGDRIRVVSEDTTLGANSSGRSTGDNE